MIKLRQIFMCALAGLLVATSTIHAAGPEKSIYLPGSFEQIAYAYAYCRTGDTKSTADMMLQRYKKAGIKNAGPHSRAFLDGGYCNRTVDQLDKDFPEFREYFDKEAGRSGIDLNVPIQNQPRVAALGFLKKIGKFFKGLVSKIGFYFHRSCTKTEVTGGGVTISTRNYDTTIKVGSGENTGGFGPGGTPPYMPIPPEGI